MIRAEMRHLFFIFACVVLFFFLPPQESHAQSRPTLVASPQFPAPNSEVTVSLDAYSMNTIGATVSWYVDSIELKDKKNERSIAFTSGPVGTSHSVRSVITLASGVPLEATVTLPITQVDIIIESETSIPSFYQGRALPSEDSKIRAIAVMHTKTAETPLEYTYEWKLDGNALFGGPIRAKRVAEMTMPRYQDHTLSVIIYNKSGVALGRGVVGLDPATPELNFYEENPLRGLSRKAVTTDFVLVGEETTVRAEPYFMNEDFKNPAGTTEWKLNGAHVEPTGEMPNAITLRHVGGEGSANISFRYITKILPPQFVQGAFNIFFK